MTDTATKDDVSLDCVTDISQHGTLSPYWAPGVLIRITQELWRRMRADIANCSFESEPEIALPELQATATELPEGIAIGPEFGDPETLWNSRMWLQSALEAKGARQTGAGCGCGQADIDIELEGARFNVSIRPLPPIKRQSAGHLRPISVIGEIGHQYDSPKTETGNDRT